MRRMANPQNLVPNEMRTPSERRENARKAGKASGVARKRKADLRKAAQDFLLGKYKFPDRVMPMSGEALMMAGLMENLNSPGSKNWAKAMEIMLRLSGADLTAEEIRKIKADTMLSKAKARQIQAELEPPDTAVQDDGFIDALGATAAEDWKDYKGEAADAEEKPDAPDGSV